MEQLLKNKIIVFGRDNYNTLGLARQLGNENLDLLFLMPGGVNHCATESKYCKNIIHVKNHAEAIDYLLNNDLNKQHKPIIVAGADLEAETLDQHRDELIKHYIVPGTEEQDLLTKVDDKTVMVQIAEEVGFNVPKSVMMTAESIIPNDLAFPCIIKPAKYPANRKKEFKIKKCDNPEQLKNVLNHVRKDTVFIVQEYIPKNVEILINGCRTWDDEVIVSGTCYRDRGLNDISHGQVKTSISELIDIKLVQKMLEKIKFHGLFSFEFGEYNGKAYFFETNLRNDGTTYTFFKAGANFPLVWVYSSAGFDYTKVPYTVQNDVWYMDELYDCLNIRKGIVTREQWKKEKDDAEVFRYYDKEDLDPWKYVYKRRHLLRAKRIFLDKYRPQIVKILDRFHKK